MLVYYLDVFVEYDEACIWNDFLYMLLQELTDMRQHNVMPMQFHSMVPSLFHTSTQYHNAASTHLPENCLPR